MKICVLAVLMALGCRSTDKDSPAASSAPAARPAVTDPLGYCDRAALVMKGRQKCFPEDVSLKMGLDDIADLEAHAPAAPEPRRHVAAQCAVMLDGMMRAQQSKNCPLDVTDDERSELAAFLAAWYSERTAAPTTGNGAADAAVTKVAALRDAACACKAIDCARKAIEALPAEIASLPSDAPKGAAEAAAKMSDEASRCKQKLVYGAPGL